MGTLHSGGAGLEFVTGDSQTGVYPILMSSHPLYRSRAVRALVLLHEAQLRRFVDVWKRAMADSVSLPATDDPAYASLSTLGRHVLGASGGYMIWMCEVLKLPHPGIRSAPEAAVIAGEADEYMEHVLERWRAPLRDITDEQLETPEYPSRWQTRYSIDAMLGARCHAPHPPRFPIG